jgi:hypothetical protein
MTRSLFALAVFAASCADPDGQPRTFPDSDLVLAVGNGARMGCSCRFVMRMSEQYCREWVKASPDVAKLTFDVAGKRVEASAFVSWAASARWVDERHGCMLE